VNIKQNALFVWLVIAAVVGIPSAVGPAAASSSAPVVPLSTEYPDWMGDASWVIPALNPDSCTAWSDQGNGCKQRVCVDDNGHRYCQEICQGQSTPHGC